MKYLIFLNKFELDKNRLKTKIKALDNSVSFEDEESTILVNSKLSAEKLMEFHEISSIVLIFTDWKDFGFKQLKEDCLALCKNKKMNNYFIETKFYDKVPISAKSLYKHINPYLKYEGYLVSESGDILYLEFKKFSGKLKYRVCYSKRDWQRLNAVKVNLNNFVVVMENPTLVNEVGDFLRLCWIFKLPLYVVTMDKIGFEKTLNKAKEETKGIDYSKFQLTISKELPKGFVLVGFSKHSSQNENDMKLVLLSGKKIALVFGDDKYGLTQETRDSLDHCFRLTPELKKPLRASHALSYMLGIYTAYSL